MARYWKYRPEGLTMLKPDTGANDDHVPSGVAVLPVRVSTETEVPLAMAVVAIRSCQLVAGVPASKTCD